MARDIDNAAEHWLATAKEQPAKPLMEATSGHVSARHAGSASVHEDRRSNR